MVVPVYNTGPFIEACIEGLLAQSLGPERCELVFVDDGSTDETPARLDRLAAEHPNVVVRHEPNSGWPGRPRNVGIDVSAGEFLFFCDHDDWLEPDGLETLVAAARRSDADIVVGKMVGIRRSVPIELFRTSRDHASVHDTNLMSGLTPHKLFRRSLLDEHGLRFPEGRRRLEDHTFVTAAYFAARNVAVVADRPIYHHIKREDEGNAAFGDFEPVGYYRNAREAMDIVEAHTEPGELRDGLMWRFLRGQLLNQVSEPTIQRRDPALTRIAYDEIRTLLLERYPDSAIDRLRPVPRARSRAVRLDRIDLLRDIADRAATVVARGLVDRLSTTGGRWRVDVTAGLVHAPAAAVMAVETADGWRLPGLVPDKLDDRASTTADLLSSARARVTLRERTTWVEWIVPATVTPTLERSEGTRGPAAQLSVQVTADIDPATVAGGHPLPPGRWDVWLWVTGFGLLRRTRLGVLDDEPAAARPVLFGRPPAIARPHLTARGGHVSIDVSRATRRLGAALGVTPRPQAVVDSRGHAVVMLPLTAAEEQGVRCRVELRAGDDAPAVVQHFETSLRVAPDVGSVLDVDLGSTRLSAGRYEVWLGGGKETRLSHVADLQVPRGSVARRVLGRGVSR